MKSTIAIKSTTNRIWLLRTPNHWATAPFSPLPADAVAFGAGLLTMPPARARGWAGAVG